MSEDALAMDGVGQDAEGCFLGLVGLGACAQGGAGHAFEAAEEGFDVPAQAITLRFETARGHGGAMHAA